MKDDPAIQAVRDVRRQISESVDHDPQKLVEYYRQRQARRLDRRVNQQTSESKPQGENAVQADPDIRPRDSGYGR